MNNFGLCVKVRFAPDTFGLIKPVYDGKWHMLLRNVTEIHLGYNADRAGHVQRVAFESDLHGTGVTYEVSDIAEFVTVPETELQEAF